MQKFHFYVFCVDICILEKNILTFLQINLAILAIELYNLTCYRDFSKDLQYICMNFIIFFRR